MRPTCTREEFIEIWNRLQSPSAIAKFLGVDITNVHKRRKALAKDGIVLETVPSIKYNGGAGQFGWQIKGHAWTPRTEYTLKDAQIMVGSDCHYWPDHVPLAHKAFCILAKRLKPAAIVLNGDIFDGANISRHEPLGWQKLPTVMQELDTCKIRLREIEQASPKSKRFWTVGNHDSRFDRRLATEVSQFEEVPGMRLADHFPNWPMSYSVMVNEALNEPCMIKHAFRGGIHAVYNNTLHAGVSIVTGHLHAQLCRPFTDYRGTRYGVDTGCMAETDGAQFSYTLDAPGNIRSGFGVLSFDSKGRLMPPELCEVQKFKGVRRAIFRGEVIAEA